ncbi:hypothetical protein [Caulobacter sp.]|uniref:hypothetical protein n=1 Tax=Caulobacter sp. TaxID=78 RepID=UPI0031D16E71
MILATGWGLTPSSGALSAPEAQEPLILTTGQFTCLRAHADRLKVGRRGAMIDYGVCPPIVEDAFYPLAPSQTKRRFTPAELACLVKARKAANRVAFSRPGGKIAVYLNPCGAR